MVRLMALARVQPAFTVWRETGKIVKNLKSPSQEKGGKEASNRVVGVRQQTTIGVDAEEAAKR